MSFSLARNLNWSLEIQGLNKDGVCFGLWHFHDEVTKQSAFHLASFSVLVAGTLLSSCSLVPMFVSDPVERPT